MTHHELADRVPDRLQEQFGEKQGTDLILFSDAALKQVVMDIKEVNHG